MSDATQPSFFARLFLAFAAYFRVLADPKFASSVMALRSGAIALPPAEKPEAPPPSKTPEAPIVLREATSDAALQLLALLQREGRFVDFLEEDVASFSDAEIGAAARVVHEGCKKALREHLTIVPVHSSEEGSRVELEKGFDAKAMRLVGNVVGEPPYGGTLTHRGWRCTEVRLPKMSEGHDASIVAPAEVELG